MSTTRLWRRIYLHPQCFNLNLKSLILRHLSPQKLCGQLRFLRHARWREQGGIAHLVPVLSDVVHFDPALFYQGLEAKIDAAQADAQFFGQAALAELRPMLQTAQYFELDFLLKASQLLGGGYESQGGFGTLPLSRFTISKRGLQVLASSQAKNSVKYYHRYEI
jgi:hypothetical protein